MFKVKKKDTRATPTSCEFTSIDIVLVSFFVNFGQISYRFLVLFILNKYQHVLRSGTPIHCKSFIPCNKQDQKLLNVDFR